MSIKLITGVPGTGKTMMAVSEIIQAVDAGREVFVVNFDGDFPGLELVRLERTQVYKADEEGTYHIDEGYFDWRDLPDGAFVAIDEVHYHWPFTFNQSMRHQSITDLSMHRHRGFDLILCTQSPAQVDSFVLKQVTEHKHLVRVRGHERSKVFTHDEYCQHRPDPDNADLSVWHFKPQLYAYYQSAGVHDHRETRWDSKTYKIVKTLAICSLLFAFSLGFFLWADPLGLFTDKPLIANAQAVPPVSVAVPAERQPEVYDPPKDPRSYYPVVCYQKLDVNRCIYHDRLSGKSWVKNLSPYDYEIEHAAMFAPNLILSGLLQDAKQEAPQLSIFDLAGNDNE